MWSLSTLPCTQVSWRVLCACASAVQGVRNLRRQKSLHTHLENDVGAVAVQQHEQLLGEHGHRLVRDVDGATLVDMVDRRASVVHGCAKQGLSVAFGPPPGGESRPALNHGRSF